MDALSAEEAAKVRTLLTPLPTSPYVSPPSSVKKTAGAASERDSFLDYVVVENIDNSDNDSNNGDTNNDNNNVNIDGDNNIGDTDGDNIDVDEQRDSNLGDCYNKDCHNSFCYNNHDDQKSEGQSNSPVGSGGDDIVSTVGTGSNVDGNDNGGNIDNPVDIVRMTGGQQIVETKFAETKIADTAYSGQEDKSDRSGVYSEFEYIGIARTILLPDIFRNVPAVVNIINNIRRHEPWFADLGESTIEPGKTAEQPGPIAASFICALRCVAEFNATYAKVNNNQDNNIDIHYYASIGIDARNVHSIYEMYCLALARWEVDGGFAELRMADIADEVFREPAERTTPAIEDAMFILASAVTDSPTLVTLAYLIGKSDAGREPPRRFWFESSMLAASIANVVLMQSERLAAERGRALALPTEVALHYGDPTTKAEFVSALSEALAAAKRGIDTSVYDAELGESVAMVIAARAIANNSAHKTVCKNTSGAICRASNVSVSGAIFSAIL